MNKTTNSLLLIVLCLFCACDDAVGGRATDSIKLSKSKVAFYSVAGEDVISMKSEFWWFCDITDNGEMISLVHENTLKSFEYTGEWYTIKRENKILTISVTDNTSGQSRHLSIGLQAGNWFGSRVDVIQEAQ